MDNNLNHGFKEYRASNSEMKRRLNAFMRLIICFYISASICSIDFIIKRPFLALPILIISAIVLFLQWLIFRNTFKIESKKKVYLSEIELLRYFKKSEEKYLVKNITDIRIKRTTNKTIREIKIGIADSNNIYINGLENFEQFKNDLVQLAPDVPIKEISEPIDYDHPMYYVFFGATTGAVLSGLLRLVAFYGESIIKYVQIASAAVLAAVGVFWILYKPMQSRYGSKKTMQDDIMGLFFLFAGAAILIASKFFC
ncbi:MAG: hypothetical protein JXN65_07240 [Clostridia bacterium]|nr:hypothetical protein [Clostridia bacterium]